MGWVKRTLWWLRLGGLLGAALAAAVLNLNNCGKFDPRAPLPGRSVMPLVLCSHPPLGHQVGRGR